MFIERLKENFKVDEPIFTEDILRVFSDFSRAQVFRYIKKAKENNEIIQFLKGVYYIPTRVPWGLSTITQDDVVVKRYIKNNDSIYGVFSGTTLLNIFSVTTQMASTIEIVTNNETTRKRLINLRGRKFIIRKSRCEITAENYASYTIMQMFNDFLKDDQLDKYSRKYVIDYIKKENVTKEKLFKMAEVFPSKAIKNLLRSDILNVIT